MADKKTELGGYRPKEGNKAFVPRPPITSMAPPPKPKPQSGYRPTQTSEPKPKPPEPAKE
jgi:outer membrane biosynthesis protein TonB